MHSLALLRHLQNMPETHKILIVLQYAAKQNKRYAKTNIQYINITLEHVRHGIAMQNFMFIAFHDINTTFTYIFRKTSPLEINHQTVQFQSPIRKCSDLWLSNLMVWWLQSNGSMAKS